MNKELLERVGQVVPEEALQALLNEWNPIILVDRTIRPSYPDFVKKIKHPELELAGSGEFDVTKLERHLHSKQVNGYATGNEIYEELIAKKLLKGCFNLTDLLAIQARDIRFYRKHFAGLALPAWASVLLDRYGFLLVPCLYESDGEVKLDWYWLDYDWSSDNPALRRAS